MEQLRKKLEKVNGKGYKAYQELKGRYSFPLYSLFIDSVQGDPFASPSKIRIVIHSKDVKINEAHINNRNRRVRCEDVILRAVYLAIHKLPAQRKGTGKSGLIAIDRPSQKVLERTAVRIEQHCITICLSIGLPAKGRTILGKEAEKLFFQSIPTILKQSVFQLTEEDFQQAVILCDQQEAIRTFMKENGLIAFIANGAILPRESGISDRPLSKNAIPFKSPKNFECVISVPHAEQPIIGMGIPKGITVIVGGGYHGKSTILKAIEHGVYNHIKGDGREFVLTDESACKIRAEDGRSVIDVDISPFINGLPNGSSTTRFTTENASGSTSQAANIMEMLEIGSNVLLIDEDTSATNFMIRDARMQALIEKESEPITPLIDKITQLKREYDVSTILVMGGSGDYFTVADHVIKLEQYKVFDVTEKAKEIAKNTQNNRIEEGGNCFGSLPLRFIHPVSFQKNERKKIKARGLPEIQFGNETIMLQHIDQLVDESQTRMIATILEHFVRKPIKDDSLRALLEEIERIMDEKGLHYFSSFKGHPGYFARPRRFEIAAAINRIRSLRIKKGVNQR